jgi:1,4-alpha-glucan branching enzyme
MSKKKFPKTGTSCEVTFEHTNPEATSVALVCENNEWIPVAMKKAKDGTFSLKVKLEKGSRYQYRFLVDGNRWENDAAADALVLNQFGSHNCVVDTSEPKA